MRHGKKRVIGWEARIRSLCIGRRKSVGIGGEGEARTREREKSCKHATHSAIQDTQVAVTPTPTSIPTPAVKGPTLTNRMWRYLPGLANLTPSSDSLSGELEIDTIDIGESGLRGGDQKAGDTGLVAVPNSYVCRNLPPAALAYDEDEPEAEPDSEPDPDDSDSDPAFEDVVHARRGVVG